eukprot:6480861-Amphidinium_carterae.2
MPSSPRAGSGPPPGLQLYETSLQHALIATPGQQCEEEDRKRKALQPCQVQPLQGWQTCAHRKSRWRQHILAATMPTSCAA